MKLLTARQRDRLIANGRQSDTNHVPVAKLYYPAGTGTWLLIREDPSRADWWIAQEAKVATRTGPDGRACESLKRFRIGETYAGLRAAALSRRDLSDEIDRDDDEGALDCICTD